MTEEQWQNCTDPKLMLKFLHSKASARKLRLFACACARRNWRQLWLEGAKQALVVVEKYADNLASQEDFETAAARLADMAEARPNWIVPSLAGGSLAPKELQQVSEIAALDAAEDVWGGDTWQAAMNAGVKPKDIEAAAAEQEREKQCAWIRDLFHALFRPVVVDPVWLCWNGDTIPQIARMIYEDRVLPRGTLDATRFAILADALEEAGCTNADILAHCRGPGPHVRGCWVVDLLLGKH